MIQFQNVSVTIQGNKILDNIREFTAAEFAGLPESERSAMGLRSIRSEEIKSPSARLCSRMPLLRCIIFPCNEKSG